jgi:hypothetical protein
MMLISFSNNRKYGGTIRRPAPIIMQSNPPLGAEPAHRRRVQPRPERPTLGKAEASAGSTVKVAAMSVLARITDSSRTSRHFRKVPQPGSCTTTNRGYSITSSARPSKGGGTVRPSPFAVLRLMTSSNLVGVWIGRSPGFSPLRMRSA